MFIGVSTGEEFLLTLHPLFTTLHHSVSADLQSAAVWVTIADLQSAKRTGGRNAILLEAVRVKSGEEWVKSQEKLFTRRNPDKHRGSRRKGEE